MTRKQLIAELASAHQQPAGKKSSVNTPEPAGKRLRADEDELLLKTRMLDSASDSICLFSPEGEFVYVNDMFCRIHGFTREELIGTNIKKSIPILPTNGTIG